MPDQHMAQRSAAAAKKIKVLIDDSVSKLEDGSKLVAQAGATMEQVISSVRRVTSVVSEISTASGEQGAGIGQVNQAISLMDEATRQNATLVEEAATASQSLRDQAMLLEQAVGVFKLGSDYHTTNVHAAVANRFLNATSQPIQANGNKISTLASGTAPKPELTGTGRR